MNKFEIIYGDGTVRVDHSINTPVVDSELSHKNLLDDIWAGMNRGSFREFPILDSLKCRSMVAGDFIGLYYPTGQTFFQVQPFGFKQVSRQYMETFISEVRAVISQNKHPFTALQDVIWSRQKVDA